MSMPAYTCCESADTTSPPVRSASCIASRVFPAPVGPTITTKRGTTTLQCSALAADRVPSSAAKPAADLGERQTQEHGAAVPGRQRGVDAVERSQEVLGLARGQPIAGAHHGV